MEKFNITEFLKMKNPDPSKEYRKEVLTDPQTAKIIGGVFVILRPGDKMPYHYHKTRESVIIALSGEATEIVEGKEYALKANDILAIPAQEKHGTFNRSQKEFRYVEFFTRVPGVIDRIDAKLE